MATTPVPVYYRIFTRSATYFWTQGKMINISNYTFDIKEDIYLHKQWKDVLATLDLLQHRAIGPITIVKVNSKTRKVEK